MIRLAVRGAARGRLSAKARANLLRLARRMVRAAALADPALGPPDDVEVGLTLTDDVLVGLSVMIGSRHSELARVES